MALFEALYGRRCRSLIGWFEVGEAAVVGPDLVFDTLEKVQLIRERLKTVQSRQKSYADLHRKNLEFEIGDFMYLKISPMKGVKRFGKKRKLSPRYVSPYRILNRFGKVAYELELPSDLASVHPVFHVSLLKKCIDGSRIQHRVNPGMGAFLPAEGLTLSSNPCVAKLCSQQRVNSKPVLTLIMVLTPFQLGLQVALPYKSDIPWAIWNPPLTQRGSPQPKCAAKWLTAMVVHRGDNPNGNLVEHRDSFASWFLSRSLQGTLQFALHIHRGNDFKLHIYSDVEWDGDVIDQASIIGYILFFGQNPMSWSSRKQRTIAHSSTGAKCRVVASTLAETNWVTNLLKELYVSLYQRPTIYYDNIGATYLCGNPVFHSRMKNIIVDFHFVHKQVQQFTLFIFLL
ncbi:hypothetical protein FXO37_09980 [Capsicum annuum]|nr:hypothetical protein FXO37_09980 [Capsicum annuum]